MADHNVKPQEHQIDAANRVKQPAGGLVLVSPIGKSPGALFTAVKVCHAAEGSKYLTSCLVICSDETEGKAEEALTRAGYSSKVALLRMKDPFGGGQAEILRIVEDAKGHLVGADEVYVNVTGGTTLMGLTVEKIASESRRLGIPTRRFGLIDRRPTDSQSTDPYHTGEPFWLDTSDDPRR